MSASWGSCDPFCPYCLEDHAEDLRYEAHREEMDLIRRVWDEVEERDQ